MTYPDILKCSGRYADFDDYLDIDDDDEDEEEEEDSDNVVVGPKEAAVEAEEVDQVEHQALDQRSRDQVLRLFHRCHFHCHHPAQGN